MHSNFSPQYSLEDEDLDEAEDEIETYRRCLSEGQLDVAYARIMLLGPAGAGKTSLKRGLMNLPFDFEASSTILAEIQSVRPMGYEWVKVGEEENKQWRAASADDELKELAQLFAKVYENPSGHHLLSSVSAKTLFPITSMIPASNVSQKDVEEIEVTSVNLILSQAVELAKHIRPSEIQHLKPEPFLHIWDCGGQPVFLEVLPAFLTSRTMFLLLYDASKDLSSKWKSVQYQQGREIPGEETNQTMLELMEGWMTNIHAHLAKRDAEGVLLEYPRIMTIGTRGDKLTPDEKKNVKTTMEKCLSGKVYSEVMKEVFIVDNTTAGSKKEDETYTKLRDGIYDFSHRKLIVKTPISWVLFRNVLQLLMKRQRNIISLREAHTIGKACKIQHNDVPKVLMFYHDLGVILFYPHIKGLKHKVILSPKWFVECLGKVLALEGRETYETMLMWNLLREKGILIQPLYVAVWRECEGIKPEEMIELLVHFRLAAQVETNEYYIPSVKQFFLPAVLSSYTGDPTFASTGYCMRATLLHMIFSTGYVTPGFFTRLVTIMAESPQCHLHFAKGIFRNRVTFRFGYPPIDHVTITEIHNAIQVDVIRYAPDAPEQFQKVCQNLQLTLESSCWQVDQCFSSTEAPSRKAHHDSSTIPSIFKSVRKIKFVCQGPECDSGSDTHHLIHIPGQTIDLPLYCEKSDKYRRPTEEEAYWFQAVEHSKKNRRLSQNELFYVSQNIGDKLTGLAASFEMTPQLQALQQQYAKYNDVCFHLLYDWERRGGERERLVEILETIGLQKLAEKVVQEEYAPKDTTESEIQTTLSNHQIPSGLQSVDPPQHQYVYQTVQQYDDTCQAPVLHSDTFLNDKPSSFQKADPKAPPTDADLLHCSRHFTDDLAELAGLADVSDNELEEIKKKYKKISIQALQILKRWKITTKGSRQDLYEILLCLGLSEAAENLMNPK